MKRKGISKKITFILVAVAFLVAIFSNVDVMADSPMGVCCFQLVDCEGNGCCSDYASVCCCVLECYGGGSVFCYEVYPEPN
jgi:hypothetical protein